MAHTLLLADGSIMIQRVIELTFAELDVSFLPPRRRAKNALRSRNAVAAWVSRVDEAAVRNTQDVDIVLRRTDLPAARTALAQAGFVYRRAAGGAGRKRSRSDEVGV